MIIQFPQKPIAPESVELGLADVHETLVMLGLTFALVASPKLPIERARTAAKHAQEVAEAYADVVSALMDQGSAQ